MATKVVNIYRDQYDVYIDRPSKWGNPFSHLNSTLASYKVNTATEAINSYNRWIKEQLELLNSLKELKDKRLGCFCRPIKGFQGKLKCHGQILAALCDNIKPEEVF